MTEYNRRATILAFLLVLIVSIPLTLDAAGSDDKPNIVLVMMDNFGYGEPGVYGGGAIRGAPTPNIDSIAHEGFQLTNYNVDAGVHTITRSVDDRPLLDSHTATARCSCFPAESMVRVDPVGAHAG